MNINEYNYLISSRLKKFKEDIKFSFDDIRNFIQDNEKDKAIKEIDCILNKLEEL